MAMLANGDSKMLIYFTGQIWLLGASEQQGRKPQQTGGGEKVAKQSKMVPRAGITSSTEMRVLHHSSPFWR
jgi:hypothetical protein